jgi:hypothetical protein
MKPARFKMVTLGILSLFACSCATKNYYLTPEEVERGVPAKALIIRLNDGSEVKLTGARWEQAKIIGLAEGKIKREIDLASIQAVQMQRSDYSLAAVGMGVAAVTAWLVIGAATAPSPPPAESCPFIYSFDGERYVFDAEPYGGAICQGLERTDWCGLEHLTEKDGQYRILIANELDETEYTDELKLVVVDHPRGVIVAPDVAGQIHTFAQPHAPLSAVQNGNKDILPLVSERDSKVWKSGYEERSSPADEGLREELIFEFAKPGDAQKAKLLVNAAADFWGSQVAKEFLALHGNRISDWYAEVNTRGPEYQKIMSWYLREELYLLQVKVETPSGWETRGIIYGSGPFVSEDKAYVLDIRDVPGDILRLKLSPPTQFWNIDYLAVDYSEDTPVDVMKVSPASTGAQTNPAVCELLKANDDRYFILPRAGVSAELVFPAPARKAGMDRSLILGASGYYDIHLEVQGEPQTDLLKKILAEPGSTLEYARRMYERRKKDETERSRR